MELLSARRRDEFLTPTEVADRLLVAPVTVRLWASKGILPYVTTAGGHRRFSKRAIESFVSKHQESARPDPLPSPRVLIIDDDPAFTEYLATLLATYGSGVLVDVAHNGFSAGVKCHSLLPDVVTLDLQMPHMNGFEVCTLLRRLYGRTKPRIVALTGSATKANVRRIIAAGADACIAKGTPVEILLQELKLTRTA